MAHSITIIVVTDDPDCDGDDGYPWTACSLTTDLSVDATLDGVLAGFQDVLLDTYPDAVDNGDTVETLGQVQALLALDGR